MRARMYSFPCNPCGWVPPLRQWTVWHVLIAAVSFIVFFNEYLLYSFQSLTWPNIQIHTRQRGDTVRLMFVADPQLQGNEDEPQVLGVFTRWDADMYLRRTFQRAYNHIQPDVVIFLGDLLDEGSQASDHDYKQYYQRFQNVFSVPPNVKQIYLAGDNDVGGEGLDVKADWKVNRFWHFFQRTKTKPPSVINHKFLDFIDLDLNPYKVASPDLMTNLERMMTASSAPYHILLNHMGLLDSRREVFTSARLRTCVDCREAAPDLTNTQRQRRWRGSTKVLENSSVHVLDLSSPATFQEVIVPTASYRMGVPLMGYGSAVVDLEGHMKYAVLWCPSRYRQLFIYLFLGLILAGVVAAIVLRRLLLCVTSLPDWHWTSSV